MSNSVWHIAFGPYDLRVDRRTLRFDLHDTKSGIVWAENLPLGWIDLQNDGETTRHAFGDCKLISVSEKAGAQGKRILFGLDAPGGVPVDVYVICTEREIQLTIEANRDTQTHRVVGFGLVPGLVSVPGDGASYLVLPSGEGSGILARDAPAESKRFPIWQAGGVFMPFIGAVRAKPQAESIADECAGSLVLITDSAYGAFVLSRTKGGGAQIDTQYERDPERRRLDVRIVVLPGENHVGVARAYRDKIIGEKNHVTLRRKIRERPVVDKIIGAAWYLEIKNNTVVFQTPNAAVTRLALPNLKFAANRWDAVEEALVQIAEAQNNETAAAAVGIGDWAFVALDLWYAPFAGTLRTFLLPLFATVYHDGVVMVRTFLDPYRLPSDAPAPVYRERSHFLYTLLQLSASIYAGVNHEEISANQKRRIEQEAVLGPLHRLTFTAFLTSHRFLTPDALTEEAEYSDKTRIVINRNPTEGYETAELSLPPKGFYVKHSQMEAHDALRLGSQIFDTRAFRIRRARDNKPLEQSADIEIRTFPV